MQPDEARSDLALVLDSAAKLVGRYVVMSREQADTIALWTFHTHVVDAFEISPYVTISSAEKRSGKTTTMKILEGIVARPWRVITPSEAVVYRKIDRDRPTVLLDEYDAIFKDRDQEPLRALLNAGNEPGTTVPRCAGANRDQLIDFKIYCPKALAGIGRLPSTIEDRTVAIELKRKRPGEGAARFRRREVQFATEPLHQAFASLGEYLVDEIAGQRPDLPDTLDDRAADIWEPLLAIAAVAGDDWPDRAAAAALALSGDRETSQDSDGVALLTSIREVFERRDIDRIFTVDLITELARDEESEWTEFWNERDDKPAKGAGARLAHRLRPYRVRSTTLRIGGQRGKGYRREDFADAFSRYTPTSSRDIGDNPHEQRDSGPSESRDTTPDVTDSEEAANPHEQTDVTDVTDRNPGNGAKRELSHEERAALRTEVDRRRREEQEREDAERREREQTLFADDPGFIGTATHRELEERFGS